MIDGTRLARAWLFALLTACWPLAVRAQAVGADDQRARVHFEAGQSYYAEERYADAAREFGEAFALSGRPEMLLNQARAHERAGQTREAASALHVLLERYPRTSYRAEAEATLARLEVQEPAPPPPVVRQVPPPAPAPLPPPAPRLRVSWWTLGLASGALALGTVSLATGLRAHTLHGDLSRRCRGDLCPPALEDDLTRGKRLARTSTALTFGALGAAAAAGVLLWLDLRPPRAQVDLALAPGRFEARLAWRL